MISTINVKPLFSIAGGTIHITSVDTSKERGIRRLLSKMKKELGGAPVHVVVSHANVPEEGQQLRERVLADLNCVECLLTDFSPIMGYATGEGTLVIACYPEDLG
jgi:fatty acid-binding protein DegV